MHTTMNIWWLENLPPEIRDKLIENNYSDRYTRSNIVSCPVWVHKQLNRIILKRNCANEETNITMRVEFTELVLAILEDPTLEAFYEMRDEYEQDQ